MPSVRRKASGGADVGIHIGKLGCSNNHTRARVGVEAATQGELGAVSCLWPNGATAATPRNSCRDANAWHELSARGSPET
eukprot:365907-Chlamydomonas_euryale.AAC.22